MVGLGVRSPEARDQVRHYCELAERGLQRMYLGAGMFVETVRGINSGGVLLPRPEGSNLRHAAVAALGLSRLEEDAQRRVLRGRTAAQLAISTMERALASENAGTMALSAWAVAEVAHVFPAQLISALLPRLAPHRPVATADCAWMLTAGLAASSIGDATGLIEAAAGRLTAAQRESGLFPKLIPGRKSHLPRPRSASFADQVHAIQALSRFSYAQDDEDALMAAQSCAERLYACQGDPGEWWGRYDVVSGEVLERDSVYSAHQYATAPMALLDLLEAGGRDPWWPLLRGLSWIESHSRALISDRDGLIWRRMYRPQRASLLSRIWELLTGTALGQHVSTYSGSEGPIGIDHECRPSELGWLLYAWLAGGVVHGLRANEGDARA